ncbi:MAG: hypothetical protein LC118_18335 [Dehalococcoidia bacterium]|nr:hypothetical protein [Dehalococcoidia bacterium]
MTPHTPDSLAALARGFMETRVFLTAAELDALQDRRALVRRGQFVVDVKSADFGLDGHGTHASHFPDL